MRCTSNHKDELYYEDEFGITFSCDFNNDGSFYFGNGGYEFGYIETNEELEELIDFLSEYKGILK